ncbi:MAG: carotenoid oxygenase [Acidimicrobiaceae bacterium]|nr:carotenoid oxygenase [Acidimicrobiaceae bacterium]
MATTDTYVQGNYAPVREEITTEDLRVTGAIPAELDGRLLRIGPNPVEDAAADDHWFTGTGMAHGVRLRDGKADWYRNRYVVSDRVSEALGRPITPGPRFHDSEGTANTNIIEHAGMTLAIVEAGGPPVLLTDELETMERIDFGGTLDGSFSAHPKRDPLTGELHVATYHWTWDFVRYLVVDTTGSVRHHVDVPVGHSPMVHDIAITESSILLLDFPCHFDLDIAMTGAQLPYVWKDDQPARVGVLPRDGSAEDVRWCEVDPCYVFHPMNAFDLGDGRIQLDVARHNSVFDKVRNGPSEGDPTLDRWILDPATGRTEETRLDDRSHEFPRHDERLEGRESRWGYTVGFTGAEGPAYKHDLINGGIEVHPFGTGRVSQEMVFVPRAADSAEDDGWCMSYVHDANTSTADVVILNAQDFTGDPVATIHLPQRVPFGFHGNWVPTTP